MISRIFLLACLILASCGEPEQVSRQSFFDIKGFFGSEINRLEKQKTRVSKTVARNDVAETRREIVPNWEKELALFVESDINKPAWGNSYKVRTDKLNTFYSALDNKLRTRSVKIAKDGMGQVKGITIVNSTSNFLYRSSEELLYVPDSLYRIIKKQDVVLLGQNRYQISGLF